MWRQRLGFALALALALILTACTGSPQESPPNPSAYPSHLQAAPRPDPLPAPVQTPAPVFNFQIEGRVHLPVVPVGADPPRGELIVAEVGGLGSEDPVEVSVGGPFIIEGDRGPLGALERRVFEVGFEGGTEARAVGSGWVRVRVGAVEMVVSVGAAVVDPGLPTEVMWRSTPLGREAVVSLPSAPFPYGRAPYVDSSVLIFVPDGFVGGPGAGVVVHAHGYYARVEEMAARFELREMFARSHRDAVLVLPQGPFDAADMSLGRLDKRGGLRALLLDVEGLLYREGLVDRPALRSAVLSAHSGGYRGVANMIEVGGAKVVAAHLYDALYSRPTAFFNLARRGGRVRSSWTYRSSTEAQNDILVGALRANGIRVGSSFLGRDVVGGKVSVGIVRASHDAVMQSDRHFAGWIAASGLPPAPSAPPELLSVLSQGNAIKVRWRREVGGDRLYRVEGSRDGLEWSMLAETRECEVEVPPHPWIRVLAVDPVWGESFASDRYGATGARWLVVDGFDRSFGGRWGLATHGFAAALGVALGEPFSVASNEAIIEGAVRLEDYDRVLWFVGDEGRFDRVLDPWEWRAIDRFLKGGGRLILSGSGLGRGVRPELMARLFEAWLVYDDAGTDRVEGWEIGAAYRETHPGVLDGPDMIWGYDAVGGAAVGKPGRWALVGFGLETLADGDRGPAVRALVDYLR